MSAALLAPTATTVVAVGNTAPAAIADASPVQAFAGLLLELEASPDTDVGAGPRSEPVPLAAAVGLATDLATAYLEPGATGSVPLPVAFTVPPPADLPAPLNPARVDAAWSEAARHDAATDSLMAFMAQLPPPSTLPPEPSTGGIADLPTMVASAPSLPEITAASLGLGDRQAAAIPDPPRPDATAFSPALSNPTAASVSVATANAVAPSALDIRSSDWPERLTERLSWSLGAGVQEARIELAPRELGALELRVRLDESGVQVHIGAAHAQTRELLAEALPRLRELLGDSGLSLSQASVSSQDEQSQPAWALALGRRDGDDDDDQPGLPAPRIQSRRSGLLDDYA